MDKCWPNTPHTMPGIPCWAEFAIFALVMGTIFFVIVTLAFGWRWWLKRDPRDRSKSDG